MGQVVAIAVVWFIIEMLLWYLIAQFISGWWVFAWFVVAAIIGIILLRKGLATLNPMAQQMKAGGMMNPAMRPQENTMIKAVAMSVAGLLLLIPGILSDILALLIILPPIQRKLKDMANNYVMKNQEKMMQMMARQMGGQNPFGGMGGMNGQNPFGGFGNGQNPFGGFGGTTVDGSAKTVNKDRKKITHSANDE